MRQSKSEACADQPVGLIVNQTGAGADVDLESPTQKDGRTQLNVVPVETIRAKGETAIELSKQSERTPDRSAQGYGVVQVDIRF